MKPILPGDKFKMRTSVAVVALFFSILASCKLTQTSNPSSTVKFFSNEIDFGPKGDPRHYNLESIYECSQEDLDDLNKFMDSNSDFISSSIWKEAQEDSSSFGYLELPEYGKDTYDDISLFPTSKKNQIILPEMAAIKLYTSNAYQYINPPFFSSAMKDQRPDLLGFAKCFASGFNKLPSYLGPVRRGVNLSQGLIEKKYKDNVGKAVSEEAYMSASYGIGWTDKSLLLMIHSKSGRRIDWLSLADYKGEREVIFMPGTYFYVHGYNQVGSKSYVELEQIYPDIDKDESWCAEDEMWDNSIKVVSNSKITHQGACRYKFDKNNTGSAKVQESIFFPAPTGITFPYQVPRGRDNPTIIAGPNDTKDKSNWIQKKTCTNCFESLPGLGMNIIDWRNPRKGKKYDFTLFNQSQEAYKSPNTISTTTEEEEEEEESVWDTSNTTSTPPPEGEFKPW